MCIRDRSVSWHVLDFNRGDLTQSSVEPARELPDPLLLQGQGFLLAQEGLEAGVEEMIEFTEEPERSDEDFLGLTDEEFEDVWLRAFQRNESTTLSQLMSVTPDFVEDAIESGRLPSLGSWEVLNTGDAGEAQSTAGAAVVEHEGFEFGAQTEFRFLDAFRTGGKPRIDRDIDPFCTFCADNLRRGVHWVSNAARIKNPPEYAVIQLQALDAQALIVEEGQAPPFPSVDEDQPIISVVMIRELGNLRFPPAMIALGSLFIFVALVYILHERDRVAMRRIKEFEAES